MRVAIGIGPVNEVTGNLIVRCNRHYSKTVPEIGEIFKCYRAMGMVIREVGLEEWKRYLKAAYNKDDLLWLSPPHDPSDRYFEVVFD